MPRSGDDLHFTDYHVRLAAYALVSDESGRLLLSWYNGSARTSTACWTLPGGGVDFDESLEDAVVREVREETGLLVEVGVPLFTQTVIWPESDRRDGRAAKSVRVVYVARVLGGVLGTLEVGGTTDRAEWVDLSALADDTPIAGIVQLAVEHLIGRAGG